MRSLMSSESETQPTIRIDSALTRIGMLISGASLLFFAPTTSYIANGRSDVGLILAVFLFAPAFGLLVTACLPKLPRHADVLALAVILAGLFAYYYAAITPAPRG